MSMSLKPQRHQCGEWLHRRRDALGDTITCTCTRQYTLRQLTFMLAIASWVRPMYGSYHGHELVWVRNRRAERRDRRFDRWLEREAKRRGRQERRAVRLDVGEWLTRAAFAVAAKVLRLDRTGAGR